jgi:hypothetical protein
MGFELKFERQHHPISTPRGAPRAMPHEEHDTAVERLPVDSVAASAQKHKLEFSVRSGGSTHYFRAQSPTECNEWLRALGYRQVRRSTAAQKTTTTRPTSDARYAPTQVTGTIVSAAL